MERKGSAGIAFRVSALALGIMLGGCAVVPQPLTSEEQRALIQQDRLDMFANEEAVTGPITLEEALRRALAYNLDSRLMEMEQAVRNNQLNLSRYDLLPQIALNSGYIKRNKDNLSLSRDESTGKLTTNPFLSQDRELSNASLGLTWNVLDFGVSYLQAHENANQLLIAQERHRRVVNQIVQGVRSAYWRAATAEPLYKQVVPILTEARKALADAREAESRRLVPLIDSLQYQKELVEVIRELDVLEMDLAIAKAEMASLMGLPPGTEFTLELPPKEQMTVPELSLSLEAMEQMALENRPELREEHYQQRISADETKKALLSLFPSLTMSTSAYADSNSYLVNQSWGDTALRLSWDLLNLARYPAAKKTAKSAEELAHARRLALSMAAMTQVHVGYQQFLRATRDYDQALVLDDIEHRIFTNINEAANNQSQSPLERIRAQLAAIYAEVNRFTAYSEVHSALANLYVSMGMDLTPELVPGATVRDGAPSSTAVEPAPVAEVVATAPVLMAVPIMAAAPAATETTAARAFVEDWVAAWQAKDVTAYLEHYATDFRPAGGVSLDEWRVNRERNIDRYASITISLDEFATASSPEGEELLVDLVLKFAAPTYSDRTRKQVRLRREGESFRIVEEHNLEVVMN